MSTASGEWMSGLLADLGAGASFPVFEPVEAPAALVADLRQRLAIRGRAQPLSLLPADAAEAVREATLAVVLPDCDPGVSGEGWLLRNGARRAVLGRLDLNDLADLLQRDPAPEDPTWQALNAFGTNPAVAVASLPLAAASELQRLPQVLGEPFAKLVDTEAVRWNVARRRRQEGISRLAEGFIGRDRECRFLRAFLDRELQFAQGGGSVPVRAVLVHGKGGSGKSALLARVLTDRLASEPDTAFVRLDFDRPALDPLVSSSLDVELIEQLRLTSPRHEGRLRWIGERMRETSEVRISSAHSVEDSESSSRLGLEGSLYWLHEERRPLLLFLDSVEQVISGGRARVAELLDWIGRLAAGSGAPEIRVVISGRDGVDIWLRRGSRGHRAINALAIGAQNEPGDEARRLKMGALSKPDAVALLTALKVPEQTAARLARTFERNPLILRLLAELDAAGDPLDSPEGKLPAGLVQGYLYGRILKHIPAGLQPYAHPGLALPRLDAAIIAQVLGPLVGEPAMSGERSREILHGLSRPAWLVERVGNGIRLRPDLRAFALQLMASDPAQSVRIAEAHRAAERWHQGQLGAEHRALELYHRLMLDPSAVPPALPPGSEPFLLPLLDDLPEAAREGVRRHLGHAVSLESAAVHLSDPDWESYLRDEGGLASKVSDSSSNPAELLDLWRARPSGPLGEPPTAILQSLVDSGEWNTQEASPSLILRRANLSPDPEEAGRIYWSSLLALLCAPRSLRSDDAALIARAAETCKPRRARELAGLQAAAVLLDDELVWRVPIRPLEGVIPARVVQALIKSRQLTQPQEYAVTLNDLIVIQKHSLSALAQWSRSLGVQWLTGDLLTQSQRVLDRLDGSSLDELSDLEKLGQPRVQICLAAMPTGPQALLFRGTVPELYRPIRQALRTALSEGERAETVLARFRPRLSICPRELEPKPLSARLRRDPAGWWLQLVHFADRARVLGPLLDIAHEEAPDSPLLARVREIFHAWDKPLGLGQASAWPVLPRAVTQDRPAPTN